MSKHATSAGTKVVFILIACMALGIAVAATGVFGLPGQNRELPGQDAASVAQRRAETEERLGQAEQVDNVDSARVVLALVGPVVLGSVLLANRGRARRE